MEFWGIEVKPGKPLKVQPEMGKLIHISQASLGEMKDVKGAKNIPLRLKVDDKSFIFGYLSAEGSTQIMVDLVFEKEFELSHDCKNASVFYLGYTADEPSDDEEYSEFGDESEDEEIHLKENGNIKPNSGDVKAAKSIIAAAGKPKAGAKKQVPSESDDDDEVDSESDSDEEMAALDGLKSVDSDDEDDSLDDEDDSSDEEELPKVVQQKSKKRPVEAEQKSPASKKAKSAASPEKSAKKGKTGTPAPSKSAGNKSKEQTPKSAAAQLSCKSCSKTFTSGGALQSHNKAKHESK